MEQQIIGVLEALLMLPEAGGLRRTFDPIVRSADGSGSWCTPHQCMEPATVAALVLDPDLIGGLRHRHLTRLVVVDIDAKPGRPSPYWHPAGPAHSPALHRLLTAAEAAGCASAVFRTPSGGWHAWIALPAPLHHSSAARVGLALVRRAGMEVSAGQCEVFPNVTKWSPGSDAKAWGRCHGFRLPGQAGGGVWLGHGWSSEPEDCWAEAEAAAELASGNVSDAWEALQQEAAAIRLHRPGAAVAGPPCRRQKREHGIRWTGPGESNDNLRRLANALYQPGEDCETFGRRIAAAARRCDGFDQHASENTRERLDRWALDWAACCIRRPPLTIARKRPASADPGRNARRRRETVVKLIDAASVVAGEHGAAALSWPERKAAEFIGVARETFRKLKRFWLLRLTAAVYAVPPRGLHPSSKGGDAPSASPWVLAVPLVEDLSLSRSRPVGPAVDRSPPLQPLPLPTRSADLLHLRRQREREELALWLSKAS